MIGSNLVFKKNKKFFYIIFLLIFSFFFNQYYGNLGLNPLDSFFSFNSGYDTLNGFFPFRDYWTITGPFISFFQAFLFKLFGVSWFSYVLQASIFNIIFSISTFFVLYKFGLDINFSFLYAVLLSILAYPSAGTPYVDHQSAYLSIIAIYCFILAVKENSKIYWFLLPVILGISFLTKQAPTSQISIIIIFLSLIYFIINFDIKKILYGVYGCILIISIFFLALYLCQIPLLSFYEQYILFPLSLGENRLDFIFPLELKRLFLRYKLIHLSMLIIYIVLIKNLFWNFKNITSDESLINISLITSTFALIIHQLMTVNGIFIFFMIPILAGFFSYLFLKIF